MRKSRTLWVVALAMLSVAVFSCQYNSTHRKEARRPEDGAKADGVRLTIVAEKTAYLQGEDFQAKVRLENAGKKDKTLARIGNEAFYNLVLKGNDGGIVRLDNHPNLERVSVILPGPDKELIPAGGVVQRDFGGYLGTRSLDKESRLVTNPLAPGTYQIAVELGWSVEPPGPEDAPPLRSNWITIEIAAPDASRT